jgi:hypothetical protein
LGRSSDLQNQVLFPGFFFNDLLTVVALVARPGTLWLGISCADATPPTAAPNGRPANITATTVVRIRDGVNSDVIEMMPGIA